MSTKPTTTAAPCARCGTLGGFVQPGRTKAARARGLCSRCKNNELRSGAYYDRPLNLRRCSPIPLGIPTGHITPQMLGITPGQPPTDPNLTPKVVWAVGNLNARKAIGWLVARGMAPDEARLVATWQPAQATTPDVGERRAA